MTKPNTTIYERAIDLIPILCFSGILAAVAGGITKTKPLLIAGTALFFTGLALWGIANGGAFVWAFLKTTSQYGLRDFREHPWTSAFFMFMMIFFLWVGAFFIGLLIRLLAETK